MIQNVSRFSEEGEKRAEPRKLMVCPCYQNIMLTDKDMSECGEVEVKKDFYIEITSQGELFTLEYKRGEVLPVVKKLFKKQILLGHSPSGYKIVSDLDDEFFR